MRHGFFLCLVYEPESALVISAQSASEKGNFIVIGILKLV
jgi:hypothetical protein